MAKAGRPKTPRMVVLDSMTYIRKHTLDLTRTWKNRNIELTSARWENLAGWAAHLSVLFDEMRKFAEHQKTIELDKEWEHGRGE